MTATPSPPSPRERDTEKILADTPDEQVAVYYDGFRSSPRLIDLDEALKRFQDFASEGRPGL